MATILVVDDRPDNCEFLVTLLGYAGHQPLAADSAVTGLELARAAHPDLVIADILMPEVDGFEFVRRLRADPEIANTRVIFYSATYLEAETHTLARACGVQYVLVKPAEPERLLETVQAALGMDMSILAPLTNDEFERDHQRLLLDKLAQKVDELETLNMELEQRVASRTAALAQANEQLRQLNGLKDELLLIASHDLRSPLGGIQLMADMLLEEAYLPEDPHRLFLRRIRSAAQNLNSMVNNLLDLSRIESGQTQLECFTTRVSDLVRQAVELLSVSAAAKTISLELLVTPDEPLVSADSMKLTQVFSNLVSNAIKFTPEGGRVTVTIASEPGGVRVSVADSGLGIAPKDLPALFGKFQRFHSEGTAGERGSGLGLAIVQQLVGLHGGSIEVASELQRGSTFTVHLPSIDISTVVNAMQAP
jgi:signal transduction histidine kinase